MEQPIEQLLGRERRIDQFDILDRLDQRTAFDPGIVFRDRVRLDASGASPGSRSAHARTIRSSRQELQQDAAGAPAMARARRRRAEFLGDREPHAGRDLLGAQEIFVRGILERSALERDQTLIAAHVAALIDGHGEMAVPEQRSRRRCARRNRGRDALRCRNARRPAPCRAW